MKIAISAVEPRVESEVDVRFGRARAFMVYDTDADSWEPVENSMRANAAQGAGIQTSETLARQGVNTVLTGHCGPNAFRTLAAAGIALYTGASGTVSETLKAFQDGKLTKAAGPDVQGHWA